MRHLVAAAVLVLLPHIVWAQSTCPEALAEAQKSYDSGDFAQTVSLLGDGCRGRLSRTMAVQVQSLLARALIYDERLDEARKEISRLLRLEPGFDDDAGSARFAALLAEVRREEQTTQVTSVSKTSESLREAPATVVVVTGEEIERRGYLDLEQLLHDLPGFDVNRTNGDIYSHVYQRGYYDEFNSRLLLLVDGVEQNDLTQGTQYLSRQYPLTNIDRVEVIYGPASTMYGANAYTGVISVITKDAAALVGENKKSGLAGHLTGGGYSGVAADMTAAGISSGGTVSWSVAGRYQQGKERDLSAFDSWDYTYRNLDYAALPTLRGVNAAGLQMARQLDRALIEENGLGFNDRAKNWGVNAKLQISSLTLGLQSWRSEEGVASAYGAGLFGGSSTYTPEQTALYLRYALRLPAGTLNVFTRYLQSSIDRKTSSYDGMALYANGILNSGHLFPRTCGAAVCPPTPAILFRVNGRALSTQMRGEVSMAWQPSETLSGVTGVEFAKSTIQSQYDQFINDGAVVLSAHNYHTDVALWGQGSWKPRPSLRFIAAGRLSHNAINNSSESDISGFGFLFTPRLGVIYAPGRRTASSPRQLVLKAIYSEAFKDPTDTEKFGGQVFPREVWQSALNFDLRPERVRNTEVSAGWEPNERTAVQLSVYDARYRGVIAITQLPSTSTCPAPCLANQNRDEIHVRGLEATARHRIATVGLWANYTYAQPSQHIPSATNPNDTETVRVPNIATNQINVGADTDWRRLTASIRTHYSSRRRIGRGTAFITVPEYLGDSVDAYSTTALALTYRDVLPKVTLQVAVDNIFDEQYWAVGSEILPSVLQSGRTASLRIIYGLK